MLLKDGFSMKIWSKLLFFTLLTTFVSCSSKKSVEENEVESQSEDSVALDDQNEYENEDSINEQNYTDDTIEEQEDEIAANTEEAESPQESNQYIDSNFETMNYTVKQNDTLMLIAFELYGDYSKWREIRDQNPNLENYRNLTEGQNLTVRKPDSQFNWKPEGSPYLIKRNETLQTISDNIYNTTRKWMHLYKHNKPLIKDPDRIYAGFTIYYLEDGNYNRVPANN